MKARFLVFWLVVVLCFSSTIVFGLTGLTEDIGQGEIDWESGVISVTGVGAAPATANKTTAPILAQRAAKMDAYRNAMEVVNGIRVTSRTLMKDLTLVSDEVSGEVEGFIKGGEFDKPVYDREGRCEIVLRLPVGGHKGLTSVVSDSVKEMTSSILVAPEVTPDNTVASGAYTGLIIDARNLGVKPALYPQIFDTDGYLLYGQSMVNIADAGFSTIVAYSRSLEDAKTLSRVGNNPLMIKATGTVKANGNSVDVIVGSEDSKTFRQAKTKNEIVSKAAVVFIIN